MYTETTAGIARTQVTHPRLLNSFSLCISQVTLTPSLSLTLSEVPEALFLLTLPFTVSTSGSNFHFTGKCFTFNIDIVQLYLTSKRCTKSQRIQPQKLVLF